MNTSPMEGRADKSQQGAVGLRLGQQFSLQLSSQMHPLSEEGTSDDSLTGQGAGLHSTDTNLLNINSCNNSNTHSELRSLDSAEGGVAASGGLLEGSFLGSNRPNQQMTVADTRSEWALLHGLSSEGPGAAQKSSPVRGEAHGSQKTPFRAMTNSAAALRLGLAPFQPGNSPGSGSEQMSAPEASSGGSPVIKHLAVDRNSPKQEQEQEQEQELEQEPEQQREGAGRKRSWTEAEEREEQEEKDKGIAGVAGLGRVGAGVGSPTWTSMQQQLQGYSGPIPRCQVEGCGVDLRGEKEYHQRHKVCPPHSKSSVVRVKGVIQRFCQQCSRFHQLREFDGDRRSCRVQLEGHNRRRRQQTAQAASLATKLQGPASTPADDGRAYGDSKSGHSPSHLSGGPSSSSPLAPSRISPDALSSMHPLHQGGQMSHLLPSMHSHLDSISPFSSQGGGGGGGDERLELGRPFSRPYESNAPLLSSLGRRFSPPLPPESLGHRGSDRLAAYENATGVGVGTASLVAALAAGGDSFLAGGSTLHRQQQQQQEELEQQQGGGTNIRLQLQLLQELQLQHQQQQQLQQQLQQQQEQALGGASLQLAAGGASVDLTAGSSQASQHHPGHQGMGEPQVLGGPRHHHQQQQLLPGSGDLASEMLGRNLVSDVLRQMMQAGAGVEGAGGGGLGRGGRAGEQIGGLGSIEGNREEPRGTSMSAALPGGGDEMAALQRILTQWQATPAHVPAHVSPPPPPPPAESDLLSLVANSQRSHSQNQSQNQGQSRLLSQHLDQPLHQQPQQHHHDDDAASVSLASRGHHHLLDLGRSEDAGAGAGGGGGGGGGMRLADAHESDRGPIGGMGIGISHVGPGGQGGGGESGGAGDLPDYLAKLVQEQQVRQQLSSLTEQGTVLFRVYDRQPSDVSSDIRHQVRVWLQHRPLEIETFAEAECVVIRADASLEPAAWHDLATNFREHLQRLLVAGDQGFWSRGRLIAQLDRQMALIVDGNILQIVTLS